ncbi:hypothetical protein [Simkania negevensis]|uniref:Uncharacterized protein n=1 Tax=Simkania negevensis (strain ATCC VR-1471 / DSM 27360 / Z) TaxID=331113 RepID=F8L496_SIMNZ|nr:hypothetical protein [Simkania negevensis]CCB90143.1 unknown protein [Simkania negevensis Z]
MESIRQNLFSKESALHFASTFAMGFIPSRFTPITMKECALIGTVSGGLASLSKAFAGKDATTFRKTLFSAGAFALTYFSFTQLTPFINKHLMVQLSPSVILQIVAFNALGHAIAFVITNVFLTTPWNISGEQIKSLHEKYVKDPELFEKQPKVERLLLWHRFDMLDLDTSKLDNKVEGLTKEEVEALTDDQVRTLHQHQAYLEDDVNLDLLRRYYALNLPPFEGQETDIVKLSLPVPKTAQDLDSIKDQQFKWYAIYFDQVPSKFNDVPEAVQWKLYTKGGMNDYVIDEDHLQTASKTELEEWAQYAVEHPEWWVTNDSDVQESFMKRASGEGITELPLLPPTSTDEVLKLEEKWIRAYNKSLPQNLDEATQKALNLRFFELKLPFPNGDTPASLSEAKESFPEIDISLPATAEAVEKLCDNELQWIYAVIQNSEKGFHGLSFEVQSALNARFDASEDFWAYYFSINKLTEDNIGAASETTIKFLSEDVLKQLDDWVTLAPAVRTAFEKRLGKKPFTVEVFKSVKTEKLDEEQATNFHTYFSGEGNDMWKQLGQKQADFNAAFRKFSLAEIKA